MTGGRTLDFLFFLGRFHVLAVHLPIGIILVTVALTFVAHAQGYRRASFALPFLWATSALSAMATVALGYLHYLEGGFEGFSATAHMILGTGVAATATLAWVLHARSEATYSVLKTCVSVGLLVLVTLTGHYGGNLTHGSTYLTEYAPNGIRAMAGLERRRPPVTELAAADPYLDVVRPMLRTRCSSCHNNEQRRAQLSLWTYQAMLIGGESGPAFVPGDSEASELFRRISLPQGHEDFMPPDGKTPLTSMETEVIGWWIDSGAPTQVRLGDLEISGVQPLLEQLLDLKAGGALSIDSEAFVVDHALLNALERAGFQARHRSMSDPRLIVSLAHSPGTAIDNDHLQTLADVRDQVVELNLTHSGVEDAHLARLAQFSSLTRLLLGFNAVTDDGISALTTLENLESLSLVGNPDVTDEGAAALADLQGLQRLYLWQTSVTEEGVKELHARRPDLVAELGAPASAEAQ